MILIKSVLTLVRLKLNLVTRNVDHAKETETYSLSAMPVKSTTQLN